MTKEKAIEILRDEDKNKYKMLEVLTACEMGAKAIESGMKPKKKLDPAIRNEIIDYFNRVCGTRYGYENITVNKHINARVNDGYTVDDFKVVIDKKYAEWCGTEMEKYLRPQTLFNTKFDSYLNQKVSKSRKGNVDTQEWIDKWGNA